MKHFFKLTLLVVFLTTAFFQSKAQVGVGTTSPSNPLHVKSASNPIRVEGLLQGDSTYGDRIMVVDSAGVVRYAKLEILMKSISQASPVNTTTTNYTLGTGDNLVIITSGSPTITLPSAASCYGRVYHVMKMSTGNSNYSTSLIIHNGTTSTINGKSSDTIISDGTSWYRLHHTN